MFNILYYATTVLIFAVILLLIFSLCKKESWLKKINAVVQLFLLLGLFFYALETYQIRKIDQMESLGYFSLDKVGSTSPLRIDSVENVFVLYKKLLFRNYGKTPIFDLKTEIQILTSEGILPGKISEHGMLNPGQELPCTLEIRSEKDTSQEDLIRSVLEENTVVAYRASYKTYDKITREYEIKLKFLSMDGYANVISENLINY